MSETNETRLAMLEIGKSCPETRVFRNNTGTGWQSNNIVKNPKGYPPGSIVLIDPRPLHAGLCPGSSDLIGVTSIVITPEMVGKTIGALTAIEMKVVGGKGATDKQVNFLNFVTNSGGIAGIARNGEQAVDVIKKHPLLHGL